MSDRDKVADGSDSKRDGTGDLRQDELCDKLAVLSSLVLRCSGGVVVVQVRLWSVERGRRSSVGRKSPLTFERLGRH
jgi:hypothetical protein